MESLKGERIIHSYDTERHQVLCGRPGQTNSTKHAAGVTCAACRELLGHANAAPHPAGVAERGE